MRNQIFLLPLDDRESGRPEIFCAFIPSEFIGYSYDYMNNYLSWARGYKKIFNVKWNQKNVTGTLEPEKCNGDAAAEY